MKKLLLSVLLCGFAVLANAQVARVIDLAADSITSPDTVFHQQPSLLRWSFSNLGQDTIKIQDSLIWRISVQGVPFPGPTFNDYYLMVLGKEYNVSDTIGFAVTVPALNVTGSFDGQICVTGFLRNNGSDSIATELTTFANNQECRIVRFEGTNVGINSVSAGTMDYKMYPNPASNNLNVSYNLGVTSNVVISIMDITGKEVVTFVNGQQGAGSYSKDLDVSTLAPGMYIYKMQIGESVKTEKLIINR